MEFVLLVVVTLAVTGIVAAFLASRPRRSKTDLEPPPASPLPPSPPKPPPRRGRIPSAEELDRQAAEVVAEAEALLAAAQPKPKEGPPAEEGAETAPELEAVPEAPEVIEPPA